VSRQVSIPRSGFCSFRPATAESSTKSSTVSIPRSGFCSFRPGYTLVCDIDEDSFNPSVGILFVQTPPPPAFALPLLSFQSLGRDSVRSDCYVFVYFDCQPVVSIPRSGFCSFRHQVFLSLRFVPSAFQSLGRDSVRSDKIRLMSGSRLCVVSIPRSGFCSFRLLMPLARHNILHIVSIPRSGFCSFRRG